VHHRDRIERRVVEIDRELLADALPEGDHHGLEAGLVAQEHVVLVPHRVLRTGRDLHRGLDQARARGVEGHPDHFEPALEAMPEDRDRHRLELGHGVRLVVHRDQDRRALRERVDRVEGGLDARRDHHR
jgi:hypothetical protein